MEETEGFFGVKYNTEKYKPSRESLERLSFIQKLHGISHSKFTSFSFNFLSLCLSLSSSFCPAQRSSYGDVIVVLLRD